MTEKVISSTSPLEQFVLLAKSAKGAAAVELVKQALEAPGVYVFGELLDMPNIIELQGQQFQSYFDMLNIFAFGTYRQYLEKKDNLPEMTPVMQQKLRHLSIVTLSESNKCIPYKVLVEQLDMKNLRELEDLVIEAIYGDVIRGKLDQLNGQLEIDFAIGRDVQPNDIGQVIQTLNEWCEACDSILGAIETQVVSANSEKERHNKHRASIEEEVTNIKKNLKSQVQETEDMLIADPREAAAHSDKGKKLAKGKSLRPYAQSKFLNKS